VTEVAAPSDAAAKKGETLKAESMLEFVADEALTGLRPDRALRMRAAGLDRQRALRLLRLGRILVNGVPATLHTVLGRGDRLCAPVPQAGRQLSGYGFAVLHVDEDICVVDKPDGMPTHPGTGAPAASTLTHRVAEWCAALRRTLSVAPSAAGRLDRGTSGLVALALSKRAEAPLSKAFRSGEVHKEYLAICHGLPAPAFTVNIPLTVARFSPGAGKRKKLKEAETHFELLAASQNAALLRVLPRTGRTHQIRRHLKLVGHPIVGDARYGLASFVSPQGLRMCLHAFCLAFAHPVTGKRIHVVAPPPESFVNALVLVGLSPKAWRRALQTRPGA
jgi:23S rRNA pseudouridine1911/1915/1917 synthase